MKIANIEMKMRETSYSPFDNDELFQQAAENALAKLLESESFVSRIRSRIVDNPGIYTQIQNLISG